ncbi:MAG TPA: GIY-YIG nuclease family protein [Chitinophagales bacterium]|nr:GIY-YIG nuclease family protein [Chitinophagales bacterium]
MYTVYILYSESHNKTYVGYTSNLQARFLSHNELGTKGWTIKFRPWVIIHTEEFGTKAEAMAREKWFKSGVGREFIQKELLKR